MPAKTHTLNLTTGAASLLKQVILQPGWAETVADTWHAAEVAETERLAALEKPPGDEKAQKEFFAQPFPIEVTEKQRETIKRCVTAHCKKGAFVPTKHLMSLMSEVGLSPED